MPQSPFSSRDVGLFAAGQRSMMLHILLFTGLSLLGFALLQFLTGNLLFALVEVLISAALLLGAWYTPRVKHINVMIYLYLLPICAFLLYIVVMPNASPMAFVWFYAVPPLAYLLLGKRHGLLISVPYLLICTGLYLNHFGLPDDPLKLIDLSNAILCGVCIITFVHLYETRRSEAYHALAKMAQTDPLTQLSNRGHFQQEMQHCLQKAERSGLTQTLVIMDIDHFKDINDEHGHLAGDAALKQLSECLRQRVRVSDTLGRIGGEEFAILLQDTPREAAEPVIQTLRQHIADTAITLEHGPVHLSATFGMAEWPSDGRTISQLFKRADMRLYRGKEQGRNQVVSQDHDDEHGQPTTSVCSP
ncbi:GGDEF domain-containing protein [Atopomonas sediminilitoris]|uniref:GGDEF domain-containing protein n=1 Tax=Atopomonas sediminilitoris TaxID=2919919 RepID=UPI001F4E6B86|nr:GGDEF domain-containing protein [Atopomonas sediminilitoris]MCJ8169257.1 GGDEF domain-containing protein [Atopomonas sediminilitoris]